MKLSKFANLVKNGGRCAVLHVAGSGIWLSTGTAIYRATELPDMEGSEQVREGQCHYCPKGHSHGLINDSGADLVFFAVVPTHS